MKSDYCYCTTGSTSSSDQPSGSATDSQSLLGHAQQNVCRALEADESGSKEEALKLYIEAVEQCRSAVS